MCISHICAYVCAYVCCCLLFIPTVPHRLKTLQAAELDRHRRELSRVQMEMREKERQGATLEKQCDILKMDLQGSRQEVARCVCVYLRVSFPTSIRDKVYRREGGDVCSVCMYACEFVCVYNMVL